METIGITTSEQISEYTKERGGFLKISTSINNELSLKSMLISCFTYGGINKDSYNFKQYIAPFQHKMSAKLFDSICAEMSEYFAKCSVMSSTYTDSEGCSYNSIVRIN